MSRFVSGREIEDLIQLVARLPGLGTRSARKVVLALLKKREELLLPLVSALSRTADQIVTCSVCGGIDTCSPCSLCSDLRRDNSLIVVIEDIGDLWALERANIVRGRYHVLGGHLSPFDGIGPEQLNVSTLVKRASAQEVREVLLALSATVEGQSTTHFVRDSLEGCDVVVSEMQKGIPVGGEIDYLDEGTLSAAIKSRKVLGPCVL